MDVLEVGLGLQLVELHVVGQVYAAAVGHVLDGDAVLVPPRGKLDVDVAEGHFVGPTVTCRAEEHRWQLELQRLRLYVDVDSTTRRALVGRRRFDHADLGELRRRRALGQRARGSETEARDCGSEGFHRDVD